MAGPQVRLLLLVLENIGHRCLELADTWRERYGEDQPEYLMDRAKRVWSVSPRDTKEA